jgi:hypothetical protein
MDLGSTQPLTEMRTRNITKEETELQNIRYREKGICHALKWNSFQRPNETSTRGMLKKEEMVLHNVHEEQHRIYETLQ